jgi:hypothetical protein
MQKTGLVMPPVIWPAQCPCCKSKDVLSGYVLTHEAERSSTWSGGQTRSSHYLLSWNVPYCETCSDHVGALSGLGIALGVGGLLVGLILVLVLDLQALSPAVRTIAFLLLFGVPLALGILIYRVLAKRVAASKTKPECVSSGLAVGVESVAGQGMIVFQFDDDEYAALFAALNRVEPG